MKHIRVAVFGSSVALTIRPNRKSRSEGTYSDLIKSYYKSLGDDIELYNYSYRSRLIIHENEIDFVSKIQVTNPDFVILNYGINEATPRVWPYKLWMVLHSPRWNRTSLNLAFIRYLVKFEAHLIYIFKLKGWVNEKKFKKYLLSLITTINKETLAKTIIIPIFPPNDHYIKVLPRIHNQVQLFNKILNHCALETSSYIIDIDRIEKYNTNSDLCPDGAHLSAKGHQFISSEIINYINKIDITPRKI
jgi:lysophospholipase L1-like esterase